MKTMALVYWSGTGNTQMMAESIADVLETYDETLLFEYVTDADVEAVSNRDVIFLGCPAMTGETVEEFEFRPFFDALKPHLEGKEVVLFGSYDWGGGEWLQSWQAEIEEAKAIFLKSFKIQWDPQDDQLETLQNDVRELLG